MDITFNHPLRGRTQCYEVGIGDVTLLFSYETPIAVRAPGIKAARHNHWGPTTGKHFGAWNIQKQHRVSDAEFYEIVTREISRMGMAHFMKVFEGKEAA